MADLTPFDAIASVGEKLVDDVLSFIPNPEEKLKAQLALQAQLQQAALQAAQSQLDIDKAEASSPSIFVAGWRPAIGWVCGFGLAWQYVILPLLSYAISIVATYRKVTIPPLPVLDNSTLMPLVMALLGLGGMRTYEKTQGVSRDNLVSQTAATTTTASVSIKSK